MGTRIEFFSYSILVLQVLIVPAFAEENLQSEGLVIIETDKVEYEIGDWLFISGMVEEKKMPVVALRIFDPQDKILSANEVKINEDNTFSKIISLYEPLFEKTGTYTVNLSYGKIKAQTYFDITNGSEEQLGSFSLISINEMSAPEIIIITDQPTYQDGDYITITGIVSSIQEPSVLIGIYDPFGIPTGFYFGDIDSNMEFSVSFLVKEGVNFKTEGLYSVIARYANSEDTTTFNFVGKVEPKKSDTILADTIDESEEGLTKNEEIDKDVSVENFHDKKMLIDDFQNSVTNKDAASAKINDSELSQPNYNIDTQNNNLEMDLESEDTTKFSKNLTVEDVELGKLLNQITLSCDTSEFVDIISYYDGMGPALIRLCKFSDAIPYYDESLVENPQSVQILTNKGSALSKMGHYDEAISHYDSSLDVNSNYVPALNNKASAFALRGDYKEAFSLYNKALLVDPDNPIVLGNLENVREKIDIFNHYRDRSDTAAFDNDGSDTAAFDNDEEQLLDTNNVKTQSIIEQIDTNNMKTQSIIEQIGIALSSLGNTIFGFLS